MHTFPCIDPSTPCFPSNSLANVSFQFATRLSMTFRLIVEAATDCTNFRLRAVEYSSTRCSCETRSASAPSPKPVSIATQTQSWARWFVQIGTSSWPHFLSCTLSTQAALCSDCRSCPCGCSSVSPVRGYPARLCHTWLAGLCTRSEARSALIQTINAIEPPPHGSWTTCWSHRSVFGSVRSARLTAYQHRLI